MRKSVQTILLMVTLIMGCVGDFCIGHVWADGPSLRSVDAIIASAIERKEIPGAVLLVGRDGDIIYRRAFGLRSLQPRKVPMTVDTVFDLASLTKPIATAASVMLLVERGKVSLKQPVARYLPEFGKYGKEAITVEQLLLHRGGLIPDNPVKDYRDGLEKAWQNICELRLRSVPGSKFVYTDVGYIVLGRLVERVSGRALHDFAESMLFEPLGMTDTSYLPTRVLALRAAPTEKRGDKWMVGEVHDPRAHLLGGVAGHAGLFSTADDLAKFAQMFLNGGKAGSGSGAKRVMSAQTIELMTRGHWLSDGTGGRSYGWDVDTAYSSARGNRYPRGVSFGHTGFTGTSIWIDPPSRTYVILLTNRVHPDGKGKTVALRREVATIVARYFYDRTKSNQQNDKQVLAGVDVLKVQQFKPLMDQKVALITNHTGVDRDGQRTIDLLHEAENVDFVRIFSPEHGLFGKLEGEVGHAVDKKTGVKVFSLYGKTRRPTETMLDGVDTIVFDIQDIGTRFYTYITTLGYAMEEAARLGKRVVVLDRPNPISPLGARGPLAEKDKLSFIAYKPLPVVHGMTVGELAVMLNEVYSINCKLHVVKMQGWSREMWFDQTGLTWVNPSPNMRNTTQALLYPGIGLLEACNVSVGRGTDQPFEQIGAPWIDGQRLAKVLNTARLPGLRFVPIRFVPAASVFKDEACGGVYIVVTNREKVRPVEAGLVIAWQLNRLFGSHFEPMGLMRMTASRLVFERVLTSKTGSDITPLWRAELEQFKKARQAFLIYK